MVPDLDKKMSPFRHHVIILYNDNLCKIKANIHQYQVMWNMNGFISAMTSYVIEPNYIQIIHYVLTQGEMDLSKFKPRFQANDSAGNPSFKACAENKNKKHPPHVTTQE